MGLTKIALLVKNDKRGIEVKNAFKEALYGKDGDFDSYELIDDLGNGLGGGILYRDMFDELHDIMREIYSKDIKSHEFLYIEVECGEDEYFVYRYGSMKTHKLLTTTVDLELI